MSTAMIASTTSSSMSENPMRGRWGRGVMTPSGGGPEAADDRARPVDGRVTRLRLYPVGQALIQDLLLRFCGHGLLELLVEELLDHAPCLGGVEPGPAVPAAGDDV